MFCEYFKLGKKEGIEKLMLYEYQLLQSSLPFLIIDCYIYVWPLEGKSSGLE